MRLTRTILASSLFAVSASVYAISPTGSFVGSSGTFSVAQKTQVPGELLKPGSYSIHVVDQLSDRMIVRVDSSNSDEHAIFLGIPRPALAASSSSGALKWNSAPNGVPALRGFEFSPAATVEFVYPKAEAAALAKLNQTPVVAVDPESEGRPILKKMSKDDMQVVTLWTLSLTTASPNGKTPAILAQRYQPEPSGEATVAAAAPPRRDSSAPAQPTQVAQVEQNQIGPTSNASPASPVHQHVIAKLPHTASPLPLVWLFGLFSLLAAGALRMVRLFSTPGAKRG